MVRLLRIALQVVLFLLLLSIVVAVAAEETGAVEKVVLAGMGIGLIWIAGLVRRLGAPKQHA